VSDNTTFYLVEFSYVWIEVIAYVLCVALLVFFFVEKGLKQDRETIKAAQKAAVEAAGGVWEDPEEKLKREEAEAEAAAEAARQAELAAKKK
jgi:GPH family glycoside/pentoside/hexuronide:cation symporter